MKYAKKFKEMCDIEESAVARKTIQVLHLRMLTNKYARISGTLSDYYSLPYASYSFTFRDYYQWIEDGMPTFAKKLKVVG